MSDYELIKYSYLTLTVNQFIFILFFWWCCCCCHCYCISSNLRFLVTHVESTINIGRLNFNHLSIWLFYHIPPHTHTHTYYVQFRYFSNASMKMEFSSYYRTFFQISFINQLLCIAIDGFFSDEISWYT